MQNTNSKTNTFLLIILVILAVIIIWMQWHDRKAEEGKDAYPKMQNQLPPTEDSKDTNNPKLTFCPDVKIIDLMPSVPSPENPPNEYYIYSNTRYELYQFDQSWLQKNCDIKEQKVY